MRSVKPNDESESEDGDSIPASSNPSLNNSARNSPIIFSPIHSQNHQDISLVEIKGQATATLFRGNIPKEDLFSGELLDSNDLGVSGKNHSCDNLQKTGVTSSTRPVSNGISIIHTSIDSNDKITDGGLVPASECIPNVPSDGPISSAPALVLASAPKNGNEPGYCGRVRIGCFACKRRSSSDYKRGKAECSQCCYKLKKKATYFCSWKWWKGYLMDRFPFTKWICKYRLKHLRGDISAGLTTGFSIIPQGLAYGQIVEVAAQHGLYASVMGSYAYAVLGTSRHVAVGPSAILSIVTAEYATGRSPVKGDYIYASILAFFSGIILIAMGLLRLGILFTLISLPVWKAFRAAAGIVIFSSRIKKWWGLLNVPRQFIPQLVETLRRIWDTNILDLLFGALFIILLVLLKKLKAYKWKQKFRNMNWKWKIVKKLFWFLGAERNILVVALGCAIVYWLQQSGWMISKTSDIPKGVPFPAVPAFFLKVSENVTVGLSQIVQDIGVGFFFTPIVAMYETLNVGNTYGRKTNYRVDYNQELIAIGVSNVLSATVKGHPICGAYLRSGINFGAQVRTPASGILAASVLIILTYIAHHLFYLIPVSAMAATIMMGAVDVCTFHKFGFLWTVNKIELLSYISTLVSSLVIGIEFGVLVGVLTEWLIYLIMLRSPSYTKTDLIENNKPCLIFCPTNKVGLIAPSIHNISLEIENQIFNSSNADEKIYMNLQNIQNIDSTAINWLMYLQIRCKKLKKEFKIINAKGNVLKMIQRSEARISIQERNYF